MTDTRLTTVRNQRMLLITGLICVFFATMDALRGHLRTGLANGVLAATVFAAAWLARRGKSTIAHSLVLGGGIVTLVGVSMVTGQRASPVALYFAAVPMFAGYVLGWRAAIVWTVVACLAHLGVYVSPAFVVVEPDAIYSGFELISRVLGLTVLALAFTVASRLAADDAVHALEVREHTIHQQAATLRAQKDDLEHARDEALSAARTKATFLANVSHELRTPLHAVIGLSGLLRDTELTSEQRSYADTVEASGRQLLTLIDDLLSFSKLEAGKLETERRPVGIRELVEESLGTVAPLAAEKGIELVSSIDGTVPSVVLTDPFRVRQVLLNLLSNAVKFTPEGLVRVVAEGRMTSPRVLELSLTVADSGPGIPEAKRAKLFLPFSQVEGHTAGEHGGTGLGLAISRGLAEALSGSLSVGSAPGKGATFTLRIPVGTTTVLDAGPRTLRGLAIEVDVRAEATAAMVRELCVEGGARIASPGERADVRIVDHDVPTDALPTVHLVGLGKRAPAGVAVQLPPRRAALLEAIEHARHGAESSRRAIVAPVVGVRKRVLVVDDSAVNQRVAEAMLHRLGHDVRVAADGTSALAALAAAPADVVLVDLLLPDMDGVGLTRALRSRPGGASLRIVGLSASAFAADRERALAAGMDAFLTKPATLEMLRGAVGQGAPRAALDRVILDQLRAVDTDGQLLRDLVETHRREREACVAKLRQALSGGDLVTARQAAHRLKGSAAMLGATGLADAAALIEAAEAVADAKAALAALDREAATSDAALAREVG